MVVALRLVVCPDCYVQTDVTKQIKAILTSMCYKKSVSEYEFFSSHAGHWYDLQTVQSNSMLHQSLNKPEHLGVVLNTDGVSVFKSSSVTIWPVYLQIASLLPAIRFLSSNIVTCGIWVGQKKPNMKNILSPILNHLDKLLVSGFAFNSPEGMRTVRLKLLFGVFDLVAKASVLNMKQFNGHSTCLHPGVHHKTRVYPPTAEPYFIRTEKSIEDAIKGKKTGQIVEGIKGPSQHWNSYMHCVLEGVVKSLLKAWTEAKFSNQPYSVCFHY